MPKGEKDNLTQTITPKLTMTTAMAIIAIFLYIITTSQQ